MRIASLQPTSLEDKQPSIEDDGDDDPLPGELEKKKRAKRKPKTAEQVALETKIAQQSGVFKFVTPKFVEDDLKKATYEQSKDKQVLGIQ